MEEIIVHPSYDPATRDNNLALVKLAGAVTGVTPASLAGTLPDPFTGEDFAVTGFDAGSSGTKRKDGMTAENQAATTFTADPVSSSNLGTAGVILYGDIGGTSSVIGISSKYDTGAGPYSGRVIFTRVDSFAAWITLTLGS